MKKKGSARSGERKMEAKRGGRIRKIGERVQKRRIGCRKHV